MKKVMGVVAMTCLLGTGLLVGCGSSGSKVAEEKNVVISDPYARDCVVTVGATGIATAVDNTNVPGLYLTTATGAIVAEGCVDSVTLVELPTLMSNGAFGDNPGTKKTENVTPITTMVEMAYADTSTTYTRDQAAQFVASVLDIPLGDLRKDPVMVPSLQAPAAKITTMVHLIRTAFEGAGDDLQQGKVLSEAMKMVVGEMKAAYVADGSSKLDDKLQDSTFVTGVMTKVVSNVVAEGKSTTNALASITTTAVNVSEAAKDVVAAVNGATGVKGIAAVVKAADEQLASKVVESASYTSGAVDLVAEAANVVIDDIIYLDLENSTISGGSSDTPHP